MLQELHIESLGVIEQLDLVLGAGLTALTGETGAGKTLLVEAISLLVGGRADATMVRPGAAEARVEGRFVVGDDEYVNGRLATVGNLAELGARFVDLHGQHSHQSLLSAAEQRDALDRYCRTDLGPLRAARARLTELDAALAALGGDSKSRARELDLLRFQAAELRAAAIASSQEDADLDAELDELAGAVEYRELGRVAVDALSDEGGAGDSIAAAVRAPSSSRDCVAWVPKCRMSPPIFVGERRTSRKTRSGWTRCAAGCSCCAICVASTATAWRK